ncbi:MAG TPA: hypothetical protein EYM60_07120 [Candidatus Marinimicrobia bacterium]|nr:hypothetical protein [Candidatus Neomarinimicrobiota bacterium]
MRNRPLIFISFYFILSTYQIQGQEHAKNVQEYKALKKRVYSFTKLDFITSEGEFNESICTLLIPDLKEDSPPYVAIYYKRDNSEWFTESLYRKRLRFNFKDGVLKLDQSNFWDWFEIAEIKIVVIY